MRPLLAALSLAMASCTAPSVAPSPEQKAPPSPSSRKEEPVQALSADEISELARIDKDLVDAGKYGARVGALFERKGDLLAKAGRSSEAVAAYQEAARAYGQSPEATTMPVINSKRAQEKADKLLGR